MEPRDCRPELLEFLEQARAAGKIRAFGIGTAFARAEAVCEQTPAFTAVTSAAISSGWSGARSRSLASTRPALP